MNLFSPIAVVASMLLATSAYAQEDQRVTDAKAAASAWLAQLDAGQYPATWTSSAGAFRAVVSQENWLQAMQQVHAPLGSVTSRTLKSAQFTRTMPNVPEGEYVVIQYDTTFANRAGSVETVTPMRDKDGSWKVSGYFVR
ncbi:DUF4019 domain-containing protein [Massilia sp. S19_KUP03_FR1]|uniref:DUF4019 domain-containing protein n=1 Tax=Massilia sp. S19_KUP03_FR1 TaxID=3025503 RepID=UPI002FCDD42A